MKAVTRGVCVVLYQAVAGRGIPQEAEAEVGGYENPLLTGARLTGAANYGALRNAVCVLLVQAMAAGRVANGVGGVSRKATRCGVGRPGGVDADGRNRQ